MKSTMYLDQDTGAEIIDFKTWVEKKVHDISEGQQRLKEQLDELLAEYEADDEIN